MTTTILAAVAAAFAGLWALQKHQAVKQQAHEDAQDLKALNDAVARLADARKAKAKPVDEGGRTDFETPP